MEYITLEELIKGLDLEIIYEATNLEEVKIYASDINRPGLQIAGFYEKFAPERIQIIGNSEWQYFHNIPGNTRYEKAKKFLSYPIPALVFSRNLPIFPELIKLAEEYNISILRTDLATTKFINKVINYIDFVLAPETTVHGVLVEVYGMGILIMGKSGVGKSETALELVKLGHRLVSDDVVIIKKMEEGLRGQSPELTRHFMEIRGIGIIDIERLYGVGAVKHNEFLDLVIELELWDTSKEYDRVGLDEEFIEILEEQLPKVIIPVKPGRNVAMILEVAARNHRQKGLGYNAAMELNNRVMEQIRIKKEAKENNK